MSLRALLSPERIALALASRTKAGALRELVTLAGFEGDAAAELLAAIEERESIGSTGIGHGVAVPHARSAVVDRLRVAYGRRDGGIDFGAIDGIPARHVFLIAAPPGDRDGSYLATLGAVARLCRSPDVLPRLDLVPNEAALLALLEEKGV